MIIELQNIEICNTCKNSFHLSHTNKSSSTISTISKIRDQIRKNVHIIETKGFIIHKLWKIILNFFLNDNFFNDNNCRIYHLKINFVIIINKLTYFILRYLKTNYHIISSTSKLY